MSVVCHKPDLYVAGLPIDVKPGSVRGLFERVMIETSYTQLLRTKRGVMMTRAGAFVRLADSSTADAAVEKLNGLVLDENHTLAVRKYIADHKPRASFHSAPHPTWQAHVEGRTSEIEATQ